MKTRILICIATILILSTCAAAFLNISTQDNSADLIINTSQNKILLKAVDLESIAFDATLIDGKGDAHPHSYKGISLKSLFEREGVSLENANSVKVSSADNYSAEFSVEEIFEKDAVFAVVWADGQRLENIDGEAGGIQIIAPDDPNSRRCVRFAHIINIIE